MSIQNVVNPINDFSRDQSDEATGMTGQTTVINHVNKLMWCQIQHGLTDSWWWTHELSNLLSILLSCITQFKLSSSYDYQE